MPFLCKFENKTNISYVVTKFFAQEWTIIYFSLQKSQFCESKLQGNNIIPENELCKLTQEATVST